MVSSNTTGKLYITESTKHMLEVLVWDSTNTNEDHDYSTVRTKVVNTTLLAARIKHDLILIHRVANNELKYPELANQLEYHILFNNPRIVNTTNIF